MAPKAVDRARLLQTLDLMLERLASAEGQAMEAAHKIACYRAVADAAVGAATHPRAGAAAHRRETLDLRVALAEMVELNFFDFEE